MAESLQEAPAEVNEKRQRNLRRVYGAAFSATALGTVLIAYGIAKVSDFSHIFEFGVFSPDHTPDVGHVPDHPVTADAAHPADTHNETPTTKPPEKPAAPAPAPEHKAPDVKKHEVEVKPDVKPDVKPEVHTPKATFAREDDYDQAKLNLTHHGAVAVLLRNPTEDDVWNLEGAADGRGVELSNEEAVQALKHGGFVKDGVTYEIWRDEANPSEFHIVKCDTDHMLVGQVPNFDAHPLTHEPRDYNAESDMLNPPVHEEPAVVEEAPEEPRGVWFNGQWVYEDPEYQDDGEYEGDVYDSEAYSSDEIEDLRYDLNRFFWSVTDPNFFLSPNPYYGYGMSSEQYMAYERIQQFILRHT